MYVCICNAVTDSAIRKAVNDGATSFRDVSMRTGCSTQCGRCVPVARSILDEALADSGRSGARLDLDIVVGA